MQPTERTQYTFFAHIQKLSNNNSNYVLKIRFVANYCFQGLIPIPIGTLVLLVILVIYDPYFIKTIFLCITVQIRVILILMYRMLCNDYPVHE